MTIISDALIKRESVSLQEYIGESLSRVFKKENNEEWSSDEYLDWELFDSTAQVVSSGASVMSSDNLELTITVPYSETQPLTPGQYLLLVYYQTTTNADIKDVIGEYKILYRERKV